VKNVNNIELGTFRMETWYFSPLPKEFWPNDVIDTLHFCEFCLKFFRRKSELVHHASKCGLKHPPGDEIYRGADGISMWEVDGVKDKQYCQSLCYLAKMFLDQCVVGGGRGRGICVHARLAPIPPPPLALPPAHPPPSHTRSKTLYYDVDVFFFYVMTRLDEFGYHVVGYYSKEKHSEYGYNLACILTLPCHQRAGYGRFLIQFCALRRGGGGATCRGLLSAPRGLSSPATPCHPRPLLRPTAYELSKKEAKVGSPEKPLSDLGLLSYRSYWAWQITSILREDRGDAVSIMDLTRLTSIKHEDVITTLQHLGVIRYINGAHVIAAPYEVVEKEFLRLNAKPGPVVDPARILWAPHREPIKKDKWTLAAKIASALGTEGGA